MESDREKVHIRRGRKEDLQPINRILGQAPEAAAWPDSALADVLVSDTGRCLVACRGSEVVGFLIGRIVAGEAEILNLAVKKEDRRQGIGQQLVLTTLDRHAGAGVLKVFLEVRESNCAAIEFYEGLGFRQVGKRPGYYRDPLEAALVLARDARCQR
jgi:ribosomal-protein-alanine acetyltransferase